ncbi:unnamed protein product, partial [Ectocarpus sp. 4 AP-2014]
MLVHSCLKRFGGSHHVVVVLPHRGVHVKRREEKGEQVPAAIDEQ